MVEATPEQLPALQRPLEGAALLGQVAGAVGRDPAGQAGLDLVEQPPGVGRDRLGGPPGPHEGDGPDPVGDQVGEEVGDLGGRCPSYRRSPLPGQLGQRGLPQREHRLPARRRVDVDRLDRHADQPARGLGRVGDGRRREHERRVAAVVGAHPPQPPQDRRDVRAEHAPVVVALVDHDVVEAAQERRPTARAGGASSGGACRGW